MRQIPDGRPKRIPLSGIIDRAVLHAKVSFTQKDRGEVMNASFDRSSGLPFHSVAVALLFCVLLGPVGLLYASVTGGVILMLVGLFLVRAKLFILLGLVWLISCVWGVVATNHYNRQLVK